VSKVIAFTGHRPERLAAIADVATLRANLSLKLVHASSCITGMANGFDTVAGLVCRNMKIPYKCVVPYKQHIPTKVRSVLLAGRPIITLNQRETDYYNLLVGAKDVHILHDEMGYNVAWYFERDRWMVDHADEVIAAWDGVKKGGTWETIKYAVLQNKSVYNIITGEYYHERSKSF